MDGKVSPRLYTNGSSSIALENYVSSQIDGIIEEERLKQYDIENLDKILEEVHSDVKLMSIRNDKEDGESQSASAAVSYLIGIILTFLLYMCLLLYGQMVMTSIIEEKNNRVLEIVVSSVKPTHLMLGKICGIGLVAVTQILIWGVLIAAMSAFVLPAIIPDTALTEMSAPMLKHTRCHQRQHGCGNTSGHVAHEQCRLHTPALRAADTLPDRRISALCGHICCHRLGCRQYPGRKSASVVCHIPHNHRHHIRHDGCKRRIVVNRDMNLVHSVHLTDGDDDRVPSGIPMWEIGLSLAILYASFLLMVWIAAKIYRVGIFMYGKNPL